MFEKGHVVSAAKIRSIVRKCCRFMAHSGSFFWYVQRNLHQVDLRKPARKMTWLLEPYFLMQHAASRREHPVKSVEYFVITVGCRFVHEFPMESVESRKKVALLGCVLPSRRVIVKNIFLWGHFSGWASAAGWVLGKWFLFGASYRERCI